MAKHPVDIHVGKRLRLRRTIRGLSQEALGNAIGVTFQQIQKYERGVNRIGSSRVYEFSKILQVPVSFFFEDYEEANGGNYTTITADSNVIGVSGFAESESDGFESEPIGDDRLSTRETLEMMRAYYRIPDEGLRKKVFELVKALANASDIDDKAA